MILADLPKLNASLNAISVILLVTGYYFIRKRDIAKHKLCMVSAFICSIAFLISYLVYHYHVGSKHFPGQGFIRPVYFSILIPHTILAIAVVPMILRTLYLALKGRFKEHERAARWTLPIWLYVSVTGVIVYLMLYQLYS